MRSQIFKEKHLNADVLCLEVYRDYIIAGIGNWIHVYKNFELESRTKIFEGERVHNVYAFDSRVILKGCKEVGFVDVAPHSRAIAWESLRIVKCKDWVQDLFFDEKAKLLVTSTAHNAIEVWNDEKCLKSFDCREKCILYSAKFVGNSLDNFVLLCGTVFGEIVIWAPRLTADAQDNAVLHRLKGHDGVIFSISVDAFHGLICTTSDDRSLRMWSSSRSLTSRESWINADIKLVRTLYGHAARVWKSLILPDRIISVGEDSKLCVWSKSGKLENEIHLHQKSGIRAVTGCREFVLTGGEDGGIALLTTLESSPCEMYAVGGVPKKVLVRGGKILCVTDRGVMEESDGELVELAPPVEGFSSFCVLESSPCRNYLAFGSVRGRVLVLDIRSKRIVFDECLMAESKILSLHWTDERVVMCADEGRVAVFNVAATPVWSLVKDRDLRLPQSRERWTTCASSAANFLLLGDRMGSLHVYSSGNEPAQTFARLHGYLGMTDIVRLGGEVLTSGRDGTVRRFRCSPKGLIQTVTHKLPFEWAWRILPRENDVLVLGFTSVYFAVYSLSRRDILTRIECGGAHRSCDSSVVDSKLTFAYVKDKRVHSCGFRLGGGPLPVRRGFHGKNVNCLEFASEGFVVTGSEDNTLRISRIEDLETIHVLEDHVSSVRAVTVHSASESERVVFAAGGRAQISVHVFNVRNRECRRLRNFSLTSQAKNSAEPRADAETRITCLDSAETEKGLMVFAGCSDRLIRVFNHDDDMSLVTSATYTHCVLRVKCIRAEALLVAVSAATDGSVVFWNASDVDSMSAMDSVKIHQSGVNCLEIAERSDGTFVLVTGGDDNLLSVALLRFNEGKIRVLREWKNATTHSGQITGARIVGDVLATVSVDQRLTVWRFRIAENSIFVDFVDQYLTPVPDVQGMDAAPHSDRSILVAVYGKGLQTIQVDV